VMTPTSELAGSSTLQAAQTAEAAWNAATNYGAWHGSVQKKVGRNDDDDDCGLSLQKDDMSLNTSQFQHPQTGIIYTPPKYSDHVAVSALFQGLQLAGGVLFLSDQETRRTQPWTSQATLTNFFGVKKQKLS